MGHNLLRWNIFVVLQKMAGWRVNIFHVFRQPAGTTGAGPLRLSIHSRLTPNVLKSAKLLRCDAADRGGRSEVELAWALYEPAASARLC